MVSSSSAAQAAPLHERMPDTTVSVREVFGIDSDMEVPAFSESEEHVPEVDETYRFDHDTTLAIEVHPDAWPVEPRSNLLDMR